MKHLKFILILVAMLFISGCGESEDGSSSSICPGGNICSGTLIGQDNILPASFAIGTLGSYQTTFQAINPDPDLVFVDGDLVEFELSDKNELTIKHQNACITLTQPFKYAEAEGREYFLDDCLFNAIFIVHRQQNIGGATLRRIDLYKSEGFRFGIGPDGQHGSFCIHPEGIDTCD